MRRTIGSLFAVLSLGVALACVGLWVRSYYVRDTLTWPTGQSESRQVRSFAGALHVLHWSAYSGLSTPAQPSAWTHEPITGVARWDETYDTLIGKIDWRAARFAIISGQAAGSLTFSGGTSGTLTISGSSGTTLTWPSTSPVITAPAITGTTTVGTYTGGTTISSGTLYLYPGPTRTMLAVVIPYWALTVLFSLSPLIWFVGLSRRRQSARWAKQGRCTHCGYDLRAGHERCPECGQEA